MDRPEVETDNVVSSGRRTAPTAGDWGAVQGGVDIPHERWSGAPSLGTYLQHQSGHFVGILHMGEVCNTSQLNESTEWKTLRELPASALQKRHVELSTRNSDWDSNIVDSTPRIQAAGSGILSSIVSEDDLVHLDCESSNGVPNSAFGLSRTIKPQPGLQSVDLGETSLLDCLIEQLIQAGGVGIKVELGVAADRRSDQHESCHQVGSRQGCIECQPTAHGATDQPCRRVGDGVQHSE